MTKCNLCKKERVRGSAWDKYFLCKKCDDNLNKQWLVQDNISDRHLECFNFFLRWALDNDEFRQGITFSMLVSNSHEFDIGKWKYVEDNAEYEAI